MVHVVSGSYERFLFGYQCSTSGTEEAALNRAFVYPAHKGPVKCVASSAPYLASGGTDDLLHLYDLQAGTDLGFLMNPGEGAVSAVTFYAQSASHYPSHLLSGAADGGVTVWQAGGEWICLKTLRGHKKEVSSIAVHPSGRLALSTSRDCSLRLWNLVKGKCAHTTALPSESDQVAFSPAGGTYCLNQGNEVVLYEVGREEAKLRLPHSRRPLCLAFCGPELLLTGSEQGSLQLWDVRKGATPAAHISHAHGTRVRGVSPLPAQPPGLPGHVASAASDGSVRLWDWRAVSETAHSSKPLSEAATKARLTCLTVLEAGAATMGKKAHSAKAGAVAKQKPGPAKEAPAASKPKAVQKQKREAPQQRQDPAKGVVHDGVVEFPDVEGGKKGKKKRKKQGKSAGQQELVGVVKRGAGKSSQGTKGGSGVARTKRSKS